MLRSVELFAGCGGLAYGLAEAGFEHVSVVEWDHCASQTLELNKRLGVRHFRSWPVVNADARTVCYKNLRSIDLVSGGPPCQPFSIGGKHKGPGDVRNMWPEAIRAVRELMPKAFLFENVRGLLRPAFTDYLDFLRLQLTWPDFVGPTSSWRSALRELRHHEREGSAPSYRVAIRGINAADYGAPQKRHRAIVVGIRADISDVPVFPMPTHSRDALVWSQRVTNHYWAKHDIIGSARPKISEPDGFLLAKLRRQSQPPPLRPWVTVRDAISDLPAPRLRNELISHHTLHPGARLYERHTGSTWDEPAKALKAGDHGVPGGENTLVGRRGAVRYFTIREMARLQGLPDSFSVTGTWKDPIKQLGNAVPTQVGKAFAQELRRALGEDERRKARQGRSRGATR